MARNRRINHALTRMLDQSGSVVYVVSGESKLVYANQACADWIGIDLELLIDTNLVYTSDQLKDACEEATKGLAIAPRPAASAEEAGSFPVQILAFRDDQTLTRRAIANSILDQQGALAGYLVIADAFDHEPPPVDVRDAIDQPDALHNALLLIRSLHQKRFSSIRLVGDSAVAERIRRQVAAAAESQCDVLVVGPQGSGREHVARTIFSRALQNAATAEEKGLVTIHCSITDPVQIQAAMKELLNTAQAHSSGQDQSGGLPTLLLIEVDQLDAASQQELSGYLQIPNVSLRMIATSSSRLAIGDSPFDQTLASRLGTIEIDLPPLADRKEDLPLLAQAILESNNDQKVVQFSGFSREALERICEYDWPGNFGELATTIQHATDNANGQIVQAEDLGQTFHHCIQAQRYDANKDASIDLDQCLLDIEERLIQRAVDQAGGNKTKAAALLGISRAKLLRRLKHFQSSDQEIDFEIIEDVEIEEGANDA